VNVATLKGITVRGVDDVVLAAVNGKPGEGAAVARVRVHGIRPQVIDDLSDASDLRQRRAAHPIDARKAGPVGQITLGIHRGGRQKRMLGSGKGPGVLGDRQPDSAGELLHDVKDAQPVQLQRSEITLIRSDGH
jgi:hypothetical protein